MDALGAYAPYISYASFGIFALTCLLIVFGISSKQPRARLKAMTFIALAFTFVMGLASGVLYIWHWYYRV